MLNHLESDFPWTLYFQGIAMPKWSNCWHFQPVADSDVDWYVEQVHGRLDHAGEVESEESDIFTIAAQQILLQALDRKDEFIFHLELLIRRAGVDLRRSYFRFAANDLDI